MKFIMDVIYFKRKGYTLRNAWIAADVRRLKRNV